MSISIVTTIKNEEENITILLDSILEQTKKPDEVIIIDGGSTDDTIKILEDYIPSFTEKNIKYTYKTINNCNISEGRNLAIQISTGNILAVTDGGSRLEKSWLLKITAPLLEKQADFVGGFFKPLSFTLFQRSLAIVTTSDKPVKNFLPSSRSVAFTKKLWMDAGGYPEWLDWGEDTFFNKMCIKVGARYTVIEDAIVYWEVRRNYKQVLQQYYRYALGDAIAKRFTLSLLYSIMVLSLSIGLFIFHKASIALVVIIFYPLVYLFRHLKAFKPSIFIQAYFIIFVIQIAQLFGYFTAFLSGKVKSIK